MLTRQDLDSQQINAIAFAASGEDSLFAADVGTGKTVIGYTVADDALAEGEVRRWLVLAPLLVATDTWRNELAEWEHLSNLRVDIAAGEDEATRYQMIFEGDADIVVLNYENLAWLMSLCPRPKKGEPETIPFDGIIYDEIDKLKSVSSTRFKELRNRLKHFKKRIGMTGTLVPNDLLEVWGQTYMVDAGQSFGRSFYEWRKKNFFATDYKQYNWHPFPDTRENILNTLKDLTFRLEAVGLPEVVLMPPALLSLPDADMEIYKELEKEFYLIVNDKKGRAREVDAANAAVLAGKLQQICAGFSYVDRSADAVWHNDEKFIWLSDLYEDLNGAGKQLLTFYHYKEELHALREQYPELKHLGGGVSTTAKRKAIAEWNAGDLPMLALHPASAGHGLNLQKSGAHHIAFLTMPWSGGMFKQVIGRLARRGQIAEQIFVHAALFDDTIDMEVYDRVTARVDQMQDFLDDLYAKIAA